MEREALLEEMRRVAEGLGSEVLTRRQFYARAKVRPAEFERHFDRWSDAVAAAGLRMLRMSVDDEGLLREMGATFVRCGEVCQRRRFARAARYSVSVYQNRFGNWRGALIAFREWLKTSGEPFPFGKELDAAIAYQRGDGSRRRLATARPALQAARRQECCGSPLAFRGHIFEPVNEQGVVVLFGSVFRDLGFAIEMVRTSFPDCEARRRVEGRDELWERVAIEFEYRSSGFRRDGHDPAGCDLVVCWIHDWAECPVEVLELRGAVARLGR